jgi:hypothetical protein
MERKASNTAKSPVDYIDKKLLYEAIITPVNLTFGIITTDESNAVPVKKMLRREQRRGRSDITIVFAVRHVGCSSCREHAWQIVEFAKSVGGTAVAVVKETGVNDQALLTFHQEYFARGPLYRDDKWKIYQSMGGRRLSVLTVLGRIIPFLGRKKAKGIESEQTGQG